MISDNDLFVSGEQPKIQLQEAKRLEAWNLRRQGLNVVQIMARMNLSKKTVYRLLKTRPKGYV